MRTSGYTWLIAPYSGAQTLLEMSEHLCVTPVSTKYTTAITR